jgi:hypothetical protein
MNTIASTGFNSYNPVRTYGNFASAGGLRVDAAYSRSSDIVIQTLDGDTVTLSSSTQNSSGYETYESLAMGKGAFAYRYGEAAYLESRQQMNISVTGDLSREELKEINKILGTLDEMMKDLLAGDLTGALSKSSRFTEMDAISSFSANMQATATVAATGYDATAANRSLPVTENGEAGAIEQIDQAADDISGSLNARTALLKNLVSKIDDFFSEWLEDAPAKSGKHDKGTKWASRFAQRMMDGLEPGSHRHQTRYLD